MRKFNHKKKKRFIFLEEFKQSFAYVKESKKFIYAIAGIFFLFVLIGYFIPAPQEIYSKIMEMIKQIMEQTKGMNQLELIKFIILNNSRSTFFGILLGTALGIFPLIISIANGYVLGFVALLSVNEGGILTLWKIFPHGIFELPAVFISLGLGLKLGTFIFHADKAKFFKEHFIKSLKVFFLIVIPLLIIAGIIEGTLIALN
jgi:stage II sporulation protein M